jgi:hypothetical protein
MEGVTCSKPLRGTLSSSWSGWRGRAVEQTTPITAPRVRYRTVELTLLHAGSFSHLYTLTEPEGTGSLWISHSRLSRCGLLHHSERIKLHALEPSPGLRQW